ncbi:MAG TPA: PAS domain S-box protein [Terriglobales bacterium]|nr:PAS domain S-box protein [Terriglobales bacterium]
MEILIADDHELFRRGLRMFLESRPDWHVCGEAADGKEAVAKAKQLKPDVVLLDVSMPKMNGLEAARVIRRETPESEILIISQNETALMEKAALQAGASRYIQKTRISPDLSDALEALSNRQVANEAEQKKPVLGEPGKLGGEQEDAVEQNREQQFRAMIDALPAAIYTTDAEGWLTHFNPAAVKFSGRVPELGTDRWCISWKILQADGTPLPHEKCPMAVALQEGRIIEGAECIAERPDGTQIWFTPHPRPLRDASGKIVGGINMLVDITHQKQAERANSLLAAIVGSSDDAIISKNFDGIITSWNKSAERIFGYTADEAIGKSIMLLIPEGCRGEEEQIIARLRRGERVDHFETTRVRKDGSTLDVSLTISPVRDGSGRVVGASKVARDITERKLAERALRNSEESFRAIVETTPECVKLVARDGTLLHMNSSGLAMLGADAADKVVGKSVYELIAPQDRERFRAFNETICQGEKGRLEFGIVGLQGEYRHMETHAAPLQNRDGNIVQLGVSRDITQRKRVEKALADAARQQKALFHMADQLHRALSMEDVYDAGLEAICSALECDRASILLYDDRGAMRFVSWRGLSEKYRSAVEGHSPWRTLDDNPQPVCIGDIDGADFGDALKATVKAEGIHALAFIPLVSEGKLMGKFMMYFPSRHDFSTDELELSLAIARQLAFAIDRKRADAALRESEKKFRALSESLDAEVRLQTDELLARNNGMLKQSEQLRDLSQRLLRAQDEERRHIARELHDSAGQTLTVLEMNLARFLQEAQQNAPHLAKDAEETQQLVQQLTREIRTTSYLLHPPLLDESGLASALSWYIEGLHERSGLDIMLAIPEEFGRLPREIELVVFRVVQECLTNIQRHSGSKSASIQVARQGESVSIEVEDQGKGISPEKLAEIQSRGSGVGIRGMQERVGHFRGNMRIESNGSGTRIFVSIPLSEAPSEKPTAIEPLPPAH